MTAVLVSALAVGAGTVLGATFRSMYLADHGRHRLHAIRARRVHVQLHQRRS